MAKNIIYDNRLLAVILNHDFKKDGVEFFTPKEFSQQMGYMRRPKGHKVLPHIHKLAIREIQYTQETIMVKSGKIRVDFYSEARKYIGSEVLTSGDVVLLACGGHGVTFLEESELIEIKQGPYGSFEVDKERFEEKSEEK